MLSDKMMMAITLFICAIPFFVYIYFSEQREKEGKETYGMIFIDKLMNTDKYKLCSYFYSMLGVLIVIFPPKLQYKSYENKFGFFMSIDKIDFYFFLYEIISYLLIGCIVYVVFYKNKKDVNALD